MTTGLSRDQVLAALESCFDYYSARAVLANFLRGHGVIEADPFALEIIHTLMVELEKEGDRGSKATAMLRRMLGEESPAPIAVEPPSPIEAPVEPPPAVFDFAPSAEIVEVPEPVAVETPSEGEDDAADDSQESDDSGESKGGRQGRKKDKK